VTWLAAALKEMSLTESVEGYLHGRGAKEGVIAELGCVSWHSDEALTDEELWRKRTGPLGRGEWLEGWLIVPLLGPRGQVLGFEARRTDIKKFSRWLTPEAAWNPVWSGLTPSSMRRIWEGGDVWVVEGTFDMFALQWAVPAKDVVLASITAALNQRQVEFLRRFLVKEAWVHMVYDNDEQGRNGTHGWTDEEGKFRWGAVQKLEALGIRCRDVIYTGGKDPGEIWERSGAEGIQTAFPL